MSEFSREKASRLLELLKQEIGLFGEMRELTEEQTELLSAEDIDGFNRSLDERQETIEEINGLHQETEILMQSYVSHTSAAGGKKNEKIEAAIRELRSVISTCIALNDDNVAMAKDGSADFIKQIDKLSLSKKSIGAYIQDMPNNPEMFDKKT